MSHPSDFRWSAEAPDYRPTIAVIEPPAGQPAPHRLAKRVERVPFGFARALVDRAACGYLHQRSPQMGGCIKPYGHQGAHQWRPHDPGVVRPTALPELPVKPPDHLPPRKAQ